MQRRTFLSGMGAAGAGIVAGADVHAMSPQRIVDAARKVMASAGDTPPLQLLIPFGSEGNIDPVIAAWTAQTGGKVTYDAADVDGIIDRISADHLVGRTNYDVALPATFGVPDLAWSGIVRPLEALHAEVGGLGPITPSLYDKGNVLAGKRYGFQTDGDVYLMFLRKDFLENPDHQRAYEAQTGQALDVPATWEELDRQMRYFHAPDAGRWGGALFRTPSYVVWEFWSRMHAKGVLPFDTDLNPQIDSPKAVEAVVEGIKATKALHSDVLSAGLFENWALYAEKDIYCNVGWGGSQKFFNRPESAIRDKLVFAPLPGGRTPPASYFNWGWSYVVLKNAVRPVLGYLFSAFATSPEVSTVAVREADGYFDPFLQSHYEDAQIRETYSKPFLDQHKAAMKSPLPDLYLPGNGSYFAALASGLSKAANGSSSPQRAMAQTAREWRLISQEFGAKDQVDRWRAQLAGYPPELLDAML